MHAQFIKAKLNHYFMLFCSLHLFSNSGFFAKFAKKFAFLPGKYNSEDREDSGKCSFWRDNWTVKDGQMESICDTYPEMISQRSKRNKNSWSSILLTEN